MTTESANEFIRVRDAAYRGEKLSMTQLQILACDTTLPEEHLAALAELERVKAEARRIQGLCENSLIGIKAVGGSVSPFAGFVATVKVAMDEILQIRERIESEVGE